MPNVTINNNPIGEDSIKGGVFFNSSLLPGGTFPNTPNYYTYTKPNTSSEGSLVLTLQKIKDSLKDQLKQEDGADADDEYVEKYLYEFTSLLVDYRDMRNYIFYGSANTELAYNIKYLIDNFPYKFLVSIPTTELNTPSARLKLVNNVSEETTDIYFTEGVIRDGVEQFNFFDNAIDFNWLSYEVVDANENRYPIKSVVTPYASSSIFNVTGASNITVTPTVGTPYTTLEFTSSAAHGYVVSQMISIVGTVITDVFGNVSTLDDQYVIVQVTSPTSFAVVSKYAANNVLMGETDLGSNAVVLPAGYSLTNSTGLVRKFPLDFNDRPYTVKMTVQGNLFENFLLSYESGLDELTGLVISPTQTILSEFEYDLTDVQRMLLSPAPINPTPWPTRPITENIQNLMSPSQWNDIELEFVSWLQDPNFMYLNDGTDADDDLSYSDTYNEYRLVRALALDETETNQLIRRCIPQDLINELNDTPDADFQRFILIAGWFFDQVLLYVKFVKYVHHLNTSDYNQLSPQYYSLYASHYGLDLFTDDGIDFSKLVVSTEPGLFYRTQALENKDNKFYRFTLQQLQYERQKRLLLSLFYLYKTKGTAGTIKKLVALLGAPEGFLIFNEFSFSINNTDDFGYYDTKNITGIRKVDNEKIYVPEYFFEIDPDYPAVGNQPPVYRMRLKNESDINLRTVSIQTNPNGAIDNQIETIFGAQKYKYGKLNNGEFASLQDLKSDFTLNKKYHGLPLTIPDKFSGISVSYMIPRNGYTKGVGNNLDEASIHLCSLYQLPYDTVPNLISNIYTYPMPEVFSNYDFSSVRPSAADTVPYDDNHPNVAKDFNILSRYIDGVNNFSVTVPYIIVRIEGNDLVIRTRITKETNKPTGDTGERVAIAKDIFVADGLNHTLRLLFRPEGVEVYQDYSHLGIQVQDRITIALWRDPTTNIDLVPYCAFEIPKAKILTCTYSVYDASVFVADPTNTGDDKPKYWDVFIGMPTNLDVYFNRVSLFENYSVDSYNAIDNIINSKNYTGEYFSFDFADNDGDENNFRIRCTYSEVEPNIDNADYSYMFPVEQFNNKIVVTDLSLSSKSFLDYTTVKYFTQKQDFFNTTDIFAENAWQKNIHKDYTYENFNGKVHELYKLYSPQVLTYESLAEFLDLIENKFEPIIKSFIPIVINISEFGRLITNSMYNQPKARYVNIHKVCTGIHVGNSLLQFRLYDEIEPEIDFTIELENGDGSIFLAPILVTWDGDKDTTAAQMLEYFRNLSINIYYNKNLNVLNKNGIFQFALNSIWYDQTFSQNPNDVKVIIRDTNGDILFEKNFDYGTTVANNTSCFSYEYQLPNKRTKDVYIYFANEQQPETFIHYADENTDDVTYINYD